MPEIECVRCGNKFFSSSIGMIILVYPETSKKGWKQKRVNVCEKHIDAVATLLGLSINPYLILPKQITKLNLDDKGQTKLQLSSSK